MGTVFDQRRKAAGMKLQVERMLQGREETGCVHKIISIILFILFIYYLDHLLGHREKK